MFVSTTAGTPGLYRLVVPAGARPRGQAVPVTDDGRTWVEWHQEYDDPTSRLSQRLAYVQQRLREALDSAPPGRIRMISVCAGQGRDVLGVLEGHDRAADVRALLVELDPHNAEVARTRAAAAGLRGWSSGRRTRP